MLYLTKGVVVVVVVVLPYTTVAMMSGRVLVSPRRVQLVLLADPLLENDPVESFEKEESNDDDRLNGAGENE